MPRTADRVDVLWSSTALQSTEYCTIRTGPSSTTLTSTTLLPYRDRPARIDYLISVDDRGHAASAQVHVAGSGLEKTISMENSAAGWHVDGKLRPDLANCIDVDLGWTPATNLLPLRRTSIASGESTTTTAAWVRFPELDIVPSEQTYTRLADDRVRYESATFAAEIAVTADGIVTCYGDDLWLVTTVHRLAAGTSPSN